VTTNNSASDSLCRLGATTAEQPLQQARLVFTYGRSVVVLIGGSAEIIGIHKQSQHFIDHNVVKIVGFKAVITVIFEKFVDGLLQSHVFHGPIGEVTLVNTLDHEALYVLMPGIFRDFIVQLIYHILTAFQALEKIIVTEIQDTADLMLGVVLSGLHQYAAYIHLYATVIFVGGMSGLTGVD